MAARNAISPATVAIMIEGVQGEGGVTPATPEYLLGLRALCDEKKLLLLLDGVQCGHYRTGRFQSFQRILENVPGGEKFLPDGLSMAKSLGGGFPIGAFWVRAPYADLLGPGTHASTFGGTPLACAVALKVLEVIERERLDEHARQTRRMAQTASWSGWRPTYPQVVKRARGLGFMLGLELAEKIPAFAGSDKTRGGAVGEPPASGRCAHHSRRHADRAFVAAAESETAGSRRRHQQNRGSHQIACLTDWHDRRRAQTSVRKRSRDAAAHPRISGRAS